jgi:hypothetical protein
MNINWPFVFLAVGVIAILLSIWQLWRAGGIDSAKVSEVAAEDAAVAKGVGSRIAAGIKKLFHKG